MEKQYLYTLSSPEAEEIVKYVGYSKNPKRRLNKHIHSYKTGSNKIKCWIKSLHNKGLKPVMTIIDECNSVEEAWELEIAYIKMFKSVGANLKNGTLGGEGTVGHKHTEKALNKISHTAKNTTRNRDISNEVKEKISKKLKKVIDLDTFTKMFNEGVSFKEMAKFFNTHISLMYKTAKDNNLSRPTFIKVYITKEMLIDLYIEKGHTRKEVAFILGTSERNIKKRLKDFKIYKPKEDIIQQNRERINKRKSISEELGIKILQQREEGVKIKDIAEYHNLTFSKVSNFIYKNGNK
jgi:transcriptional regulator